MVASKSKSMGRLRKRCLGTRLSSLLLIANLKHWQKSTRRTAMNVNKNKENLFTRLTDDLLCEIISRLNSRDAIRTSILSRRWRNLWQGASLKHIYFEARCMPQSKAQNLMGQLMAFLASRSGTVVESMEIKCFLLGNFRHETIRDCIRFATKNKVQRLDLNFSLEIPEVVFHICPLPFYRGEEPASVKHLSMSSFLLTHYTGAHGNFKSLLSLTLKHALVSEYQLRGLLLNCVSLESLRIEECFGLERFEDSNHGVERLPFAQPLRLKHLNISNCVDMKMVDVSEVKCLVSLNYVGDALDELICGSKNGGVTLSVKRVSLHVSNYDPKHLDSLANGFPHLETLSLYQPFIHGSESLPTFSSIKIFELVLVQKHPEDLWPQVSNILKASPSLNKLELHFPMLEGESRSIKEIASSEDHQHVNLKEVVFHNYSGQAREVELLKQIVNCAKSIEKIHIHQQPHQQHKYPFIKLPSTIKLQVF